MQRVGNSFLSFASAGTTSARVMIVVSDATKSRFADSNFDVSSNKALKYKDSDLID
jgi:hypothetical protein